MARNLLATAALATALAGNTPAVDTPTTTSSGSVIARTATTSALLLPQSATVAHTPSLTERETIYKTAYERSVQGSDARSRAVVVNHLLGYINALHEVERLKKCITDTENFLAGCLPEWPAYQKVQKSAEHLPQRLVRAQEDVQIHWEGVPAALRSLDWKNIPLNTKDFLKSEFILGEKEFYRWHYNIPESTPTHNKTGWIIGGVALAVASTIGGVALLRRRKEEESLEKESDTSDQLFEEVGTDNHPSEESDGAQEDLVLSEALRQSQIQAQRLKGDVAAALQTNEVLLQENKKLREQIKSPSSEEPAPGLIDALPVVEIVPEGDLIDARSADTLPTQEYPLSPALANHLPHTSTPEQFFDRIVAEVPENHFLCVPVQSRQEDDKSIRQAIFIWMVSSDDTNTPSKKYIALLDNPSNIPESLQKGSPVSSIDSTWEYDASKNRWALDLIHKKKAEKRDLRPNNHVFVSLLQEILRIAKGQ